MIYLDNAATSFPKPLSVIEEINFCLKRYSGNPGRSGHALSVAAAEKIFETRECIAEHFSFKSPENVVFTLNATYALNFALRTVIEPGSHVLTSDIEHNAVMRPLELLRTEGRLDYSLFKSNGDLRENINTAVRDDTKAVVATLASNVTGRRLPLSVLSSVAKELGLLLIVDASQAAGHEKIDLGKTPCDCFCAPGHKGLFGVQGTGFAIFSSSDKIKPFIAGGSGTNSESLIMPRLLPEALEAGTLPTPAVASLCAGVKFINSVGVEDIDEREISLAKRLKTGLSCIKDIVIYESYGSIILFNIKGISEAALCAALDKRGVCVRGGLHCAPMAHRLLGTEKTGAVRASLSYFNTTKDIDEFLKILNKIKAEI